MGRNFEGDLRTTVIGKAVGLASHRNSEIDSIEAAFIAAELYDRVTERQGSRSRTGERLTNKIFKARLYCHIFFALVLYGWPKTINFSNGSKRIKPSSISCDQRLGYPSRTKIYTAYKKIRDVCGRGMITRDLLSASLAGYCSKVLGHLSDFQVTQKNSKTSLTVFYLPASLYHLPTIA